MISFINALSVRSIIILCISCILACFIIIFNKKLKLPKSDICMLWITIGGMIVVAIYKIISAYFSWNNTLQIVSIYILFSYIFFFFVSIVVCSLLKCKTENFPLEKRRLLYSCIFIIIVLLLLWAVLLIKTDN